jgi:hypothetical protein
MYELISRQTVHFQKIYPLVVRTYFKQDEGQKNTLILEVSVL